MLKLKLLTIALTAFIAANITFAAEPKIVTYPAPKSESVISSYKVSVNGKPLDIYKALSPNYEGGEYYLAYFDFEGEVNIKVESRKEMKNPEVYPYKFDVKKGKNKLSFKADKPFQAVVIRNERAMPLVIFGNPIEKDIPAKDDPNVIFFDAGVHYTDVINLGDNQTLYIAGGAVVKSSLKAKGNNIKVRGRGILSFDNRERFTSGATNFVGCKNLEVRDIILKDPMTWTLVFRNCDGVKVDNLKICASRMINDDAIDICNTSNISIKNTFARAQDDIIAIKGIANSGSEKMAEGDNSSGRGATLPCENITVEDSILWTDSANTFRIGYECHTPRMSNLRCKNLYVPFYAPYRDPMDYWSHAIIWFQPTNNMPMTDMHFDGIDIRSNGENMPLAIGNPRKVRYADTSTGGMLSNCIVKNVKVHGKKGSFTGAIYMNGMDSTHNVKNMTFENINYFDTPIKQDSSSVFIGDFVSDVVVK